MKPRGGTVSSISDLLTKLENATPDNAPFLVRELLQDHEDVGYREHDQGGDTDPVLHEH